VPRGSRERVGRAHLPALQKTEARPRFLVDVARSQAYRNAAIKEQSSKSASELASGEQRRSNAKHTRREMERAIQGASKRTLLRLTS